MLLNLTKWYQPIVFRGLSLFVITWLQKCTSLGLLHLAHLFLITVTVSVCVCLVVLYGESGTGSFYGRAERSDAWPDHTDAGLAGGGHRRWPAAHPFGQPAGGACAGKVWSDQHPKVSRIKLIHRQFTLLVRYDIYVQKKTQHPWNVMPQKLMNAQF